MIMEKLIFALNLVERKKFIENFGSEVVEVVENDLTTAFGELITGLLEQHRIHSEVINPIFGCWYVIFFWREEGIPFSETEQLASITQAGEKLVRQMLQEELGMATGTSIKFELGIYELEDEVEESSGEVKCDLITQKESKSSYVKTKQEELRDIIDKRQVNIHLQPIVDLQLNEIAGFEALTRGPQDSSLRSPADLFGVAGEYGLTEELELLCVEEAINLIEELPNSYWLSINLGPDLLVNDRIKEIITELKSKDSTRIVLELTEHLPLLANKGEIQEIKEFLEQQGVKLALDDVGCGFANLEAIKKLRPEIVKLCITVVSRIKQQPQIKKKINQIAGRVSSLNGEVLGEGIEEKQQFLSLKEAGVKYGQGYYFSKPHPAREVVSDIIKSDINYI